MENSAAPAVAKKKGTTRIYRVYDIAVETKVKFRLVRASTPAQALRHVVEPRFSVSVATIDEALDLQKAGVEVEIAKSEE